MFNIQSHSQVVVFFVCVKGVLLSFCSSVTWPVIQQCVCCFKRHHRKVPDSVKLNGTHPLAVLNVSGPTLLTALQVQHQYSSLIITRETAAWSILHPGLYRAARPSPCQANRRKSKKKKANDYQKPGKPGLFVSECLRQLDETKVWPHDILLYRLNTPSDLAQSPYGLYHSVNFVNK